MPISSCPLGGGHVPKSSHVFLWNFRQGAQAPSCWSAYCEAPLLAANCSSANNSDPNTGAKWPWLLWHTPLDMPGRSCLKHWNMLCKCKSHRGTQVCTLVLFDWKLNEKGKQTSHCKVRHNKVSHSLRSWRAATTHGKPACNFWLIMNGPHHRKLQEAWVPQSLQHIWKILSGPVLLHDL